MGFLIWYTKIWANKNFTPYNTIVKIFAKPNQHFSQQSKGRHIVYVITREKIIANEKFSPMSMGAKSFLLAIISGSTIRFPNSIPMESHFSKFNYLLYGIILFWSPEKVKAMHISTHGYTCRAKWLCFHNLQTCNVLGHIIVMLIDKIKLLHSAISRNDFCNDDQ